MMQMYGVRGPSLIYGWVLAISAVVNLSNYGTVELATRVFNGDYTVPNIVINAWYAIVFSTIGNNHMAYLLTHRAALSSLWIIRCAPKWARDAQYVLASTIHCLIRYATFSLRMHNMHVNAMFVGNTDVRKQVKLLQLDIYNKFKFSLTSYIVSPSWWICPRYTNMFPHFFPSPSPLLETCVADRNC
jgi:hypothetical protein